MEIRTGLLKKTMAWIDGWNGLEMSHNLIFNF